MKRMREHRGWLLLGLVVVAAALPACGGGTSGGTGSGNCPATCSGCCDGEVCQPGNTAAACGKPGEACTACGAGNVCNVIHACANGNDPCQGISPDGVCSADTTVAYCTASTDNGAAQVATYTCQTGEKCQASGAGAACVLTAACHEGATECTNGTTLRTCRGGAWQAAACSRQCIQSPIGDFCGINEATQTLTGTLAYEARGPNASPPTDWGPLVSVPGQGFLVIVARQVSGGQQLIDSRLTSETQTPGTFSVLVPSAPTANDFLIFLAVGTVTDPATGSPTLAYAVADPNLPASSTAYPVGTVGNAPSIWSWSLPVRSATPGGTITIREASFSGAARVLDYARYIAEIDGARFTGTHTLNPFLIWLAPGVEWSCGSCEAPVRATRFGTTFGAQIFFGGGNDQGYWADSVTAHELGHYTMGTYGHAVGEGGQHCIGNPGAPGLAWSEGYASWFSSDARADPMYIDKQRGSMFWLDLSQRSTSGSPWPRPVAAGGLKQDIYEFEVSAMMWNLSATQRVGRAPMDAALRSQRMTIPPFERGYTREQWEVSPTTCQRTNIQDTGVSTTFFADFLDALVCSGVGASAVNAATNPSVNYPYPSGAPLCRP